MLSEFLSAGGTKKRELCRRLTFDIEQLFAMRITHSSRPRGRDLTTYKCVSFNNNREVFRSRSLSRRNLNSRKVEFHTWRRTLRVVINTYLLLS